MCFPLHEFYVNDDVVATTDLTTPTKDVIPAGTVGKVADLVGWAPDDNFHQTVAFGDHKVEASDRELALR